MLLRSSLLVLLLVVVAAVLAADSEPAESAHNYDEDSQEEPTPAEERSASGGGRRKPEYTPEEKEEYNLSAEEEGEPSEDVVKDEKTSYTSMIIEPGQQRSMSYKDGGTRSSKTYYKPYRQTEGSNYKPYKNPKLVEKNRPPPPESFFTGLHPSIMRNLLKQEPQTFTDSQQGQKEADQASPNWQVTTNSGKRFGAVKTGYSLQRDHSGRQGSFGINKNPIYVPNRVSVQNPSSDSSFNVGYSIGFGNGQAQPLVADYSDPSTNLRQGKEISVPMSYQNTPVSLHFNGRDTFWKNMGSGVEMSQSVDVNPKPYQYYNDKPTSDYNNQSPVPVTPQPSYSSDELDVYPTPGPFSFDHNHALQQSNTFDFSNAIDPTTNKPYSTDKLNQMNKDSLSKPHFQSFTDSMNTQYFESSPRQSRPSHVELSKETKSHSASPHHTHNGDRQGKFEAYKHEFLRYEHPSFSDSSIKSSNHATYHPSYSDSSLKSSIPVTYHPKLVPIDFSKSLSNGPKPALPPSYPLKATSTVNTHQISATNYDTLGFPGFPITPQMFTPAGKVPPPGMIQAILVPVNAPGTNPFTYPVGMSMVGNGYSPYLGHPLGMVRIPEPVGAEPPLHVGSELQNLEMNSQPASHPEEYSSMESSPAKQVHTHYTIVKHIKEQPAEPSQYHFQKASYPLRTEDNHHIVKIKKAVVTEAPTFVTSPVTYYPSPHFPQPISSNPQLPRLHGASMIIVKRT